MVSIAPSTPPRSLIASNSLYTASSTRSVSVSTTWLPCHGFSLKLYCEARNALVPESLRTLQNTARERKNVFEQLMEAVKYDSLGQISHALYDVGGGHRRNM